MSAGLLDRTPAPARSARRGGTPPPVRQAALALLALLAATQWASLLESSPRGRLVVAAALGLLTAAAAARAAGRVRGHAARGAARVAPAAAGLAVLLLAAGVPAGLLYPRAWGSLAAGLAQGAAALATVRLPYAGPDPWVAIALIAGFGLLMLCAGLLAARASRRRTAPLGAAVVATAAYTVAALERTPGQPLLSGAVLAVLLGALLWGERIERSQALPALAFAALPLASALLVAPRLDRAGPWVDYEGMVEALASRSTVRFDWNQGYGPLDWPRRNRVMLRVASRRPRYWKATDLARFDGTRWLAAPVPAPAGLTEFAPDHADWRVQLRVTVAGVRSPSYLTAGTALSVRDSPRQVRVAGPGTFSTGREPLRRGDSYRTEVYVPTPSVRELRAAGTDYPAFVRPYLAMDLPRAAGGPAAPEGGPSSRGGAALEFPRFGLFSARAPVLAVGPAARTLTGAALLRASRYAPMWGLARRLRSRADTPYEYVRLVQARLAAGYVYDERPPRPRAGRPPLVSFLFDSRRGYCQQFSGSMALLLRMGGVPARVSAGFAPGTFDTQRGEWVVRDVDAHSWVEAYFPRLGWVTFDPTPAIAPPRNQLVTGPAPRGPREIPLRAERRPADVPARPAPAPVPAPAGGGGAGRPRWIALPAGLVAAALGAVALLLARRGRTAPPGALAELERALRVTGRPAPPALTLQALERRFAHAPGAAAYLATLRLERYGGRREGPTGQQRAALRRELAAGLGASGRLRAWWALPPRLH